MLIKNLLALEMRKYMNKQNMIEMVENLEIMTRDHDIMDKRCRQPMIRLIDEKLAVQVFVMFSTLTIP